MRCRSTIRTPVEPTPPTATYCPPGETTGSHAPPGSATDGLFNGRSVAGSSHARRDPLYAATIASSAEDFGEAGATEPTPVPEPPEPGHDGDEGEYSSDASHLLSYTSSISEVPMARAGIEPATPRFSAVCSTD